TPGYLSVRTIGVFPARAVHSGSFSGGSARKLRWEMCARGWHTQFLTPRKRPKIHPRAHSHEAVLCKVDPMTAVSAERDSARQEVPEQLRSDVNLLGEMLGTILAESGGEDLLAD